MAGTAERTQVWGALAGSTSTDDRTRIADQELAPKVAGIVALVGQHLASSWAAAKGTYLRNPEDALQSGRSVPNDSVPHRDYSQQR